MQRRCIYNFVLWLFPYLFNSLLITFFMAALLPMFFVFTHNSRIGHFFRDAYQCVSFWMLKESAKKVVYIWFRENLNLYLYIFIFYIWFRKNLNLLNIYKFWVIKKYEEIKGSSLRYNHATVRRHVGKGIFTVYRHAREIIKSIDETKDPNQEKSIKMQLIF